MKFSRTAMANIEVVALFSSQNFLDIFFWRWKGYFIGKENYF